MDNPVSNFIDGRSAFAKFKSSITEEGKVSIVDGGS
jgi:hypothetical protein